MNDTDITNKTIYLCDDTIEGIFTAIYKAWDNNPKTTDVRIRSSSSSLSFFESYVDTDTDYELALKVHNTIIRKLSWDIYFYIYRTALSYEEERASYIYSFLKKAFKTGPAIINMLHDDDVLKIFNIDKQVGRESHSFLEFVRFEELANSVLVSRIEPKSNIIPLISEHFADRLHCENWIILDTG